MRCHPHWGDSERQALSLSISLFTSLLIGYRLEPLGKLRMSPTPGPVRGSLASVGPCIRLRPLRQQCLDNFLVPAHRSEV